MGGVAKIHDGHGVFWRLGKWLFLSLLLQHAARFVMGTRGPYWTSIPRSKPTGGALR